VVVVWSPYVGNVVDFPSCGSRFYNLNVFRHASSLWWESRFCGMRRNDEREELIRVIRELKDEIAKLRKKE
jgi:hypothetical protein